MGPENSPARSIVTLLKRQLLDEALASPSEFLKLLGESRYRPHVRTNGERPQIPF